MIVAKRDIVNLLSVDGEHVHETTTTTRIFLADEYQIVRQGLRALLEKETGLEVEIEAILNVTSSFTSPAYHFLNLYLLACVVGGELVPGDDLDAAAWFPLAGPYPELAFEEDVDILIACAKGLKGLPVEAGNLRPIK